MSSRAYHVHFCKVCENRKFDPQQGYICKLTGEKADFEDDCSDYIPVPKLEIQRDKEEAERKEEELRSKTGGLHKFGIKNGIVAGALLLTASIIWLIVGWINDYIFFYPIILFFIGLVTLIKGFVTAAQEQKKNAEDKWRDEVLDDNYDL